MIPRTAVIYSNGSLECERAASLLKSLGGEYLEYRLNHHFTQRAFETEFGPEAEYPQIALGAQHVGHLKELLQYGKDRDLF
jgi:glutaredoxin